MTEGDIIYCQCPQRHTTTVWEKSLTKGHAGKKLNVKSYFIKGLI